MSTEYIFPTTGLSGENGASTALGVRGTFDGSESSRNLGVDIACFPDLDPELRLISGFAVLAQDLLHRFETPAGGLWYDLTYGYDLRALLLKALDSSDVRKIEVAIATQARLDERVLDLDVTVALDRAMQRMKITMGVETEEGPFSLVLGVDAVSASILEIR